MCLPSPIFRLPNVRDFYIEASKRIQPTYSETGTLLRSRVKTLSQLDQDRPETKQNMIFKKMPTVQKYWNTMLQELCYLYPIEQHIVVCNIIHD